MTTFIIIMQAILLIIALIEFKKEVKKGNSKFGIYNVLFIIVVILSKMANDM